MEEIVMHKQFARIAAVALLVLLAAVGASAQSSGGSLAYGSAQVGTLSQSAPLVFYSFQASAGDLIAVDVLSLTPSLNPSVSLLGPTQQQIAANDNNPLTSGALDAHLSWRLDANGTYALLVGGVAGSTGDFVIKLNGQAGGAPVALQSGGATSADFNTNAQAQVFSIPADPAGPTALELAADPVGFAFNGRVFGPNGGLLAAFTGLPGATLTLPQGIGSATLVLEPASTESTGVVRLATGGASTGGPAVQATLRPVATQPAITGPAPTDFCNVSSGGTVNLRSGPGTNFGVVGQLNPGNFLPVQGVSPDRGWYAVTFNNQMVWVSNTVVALNGPCSNLPTVQGPAIQPPGPTFTPTGTGTVGQPTSTLAVTATATEPGPTLAPTDVPPTSAPTAPPDSDHQVQLDRNNGGSFSQVISYPDGDTTDRVTARVTNFDSITTSARFNVTLVCSGTGTEYVRWGENQNANLQCGGNLELFFTNDSNQRFLNITLPSGSGPAYVNYTLVFVKVG
jgi:uncharacterized protein YraI